ncbi:MAG: hypothetical protein HQK49_13640 [Oligoflexia bacterium]|nr:hypothetical protein [Oligoflexia bacterium]
MKTINDFKITKLFSLYISFSLSLCLFLSLLCSICLPINNSEAKDKIKWVIMDFPPAYFISGPLKGKGFAQVALEIFVKNLPEYEHEFVELSGVAANALLLKHSDKNILLAAPMHGMTVQKAKADGYNIILSNPTLYVPPIGIAVRKEDLNKFSNGDPVSLEKLLQNNKLSLGVPNYKSGGISKEVTDLIEKYKDKVTVNNDNTAKPSVLIKQLLNKRFDYAINWAFAIHNAIVELQVKDQVVFIPITEVPFDSGPSHALFSNTANAKVLVEKINKIIITDEYKKAVIASLTQFIPDNIIKQYSDLNNEKLGN